jgi:O-antigen/teichoic acid export membrane protein
MGFALSLVLARQLGAAGSGVVLQAIASFMIGLSLARLGMDTAAVWILPRLRSEQPSAVRGACTGLLLSTFLAGGLGALGWWGAALALPETRVTETISVIAWALPVASVMLVALAATRALGGVLPFNLIGNMAVPAARPVGVLVVTLLGGSVFAAATIWAVPFLPGLALAVWILVRQVRRFERRREVQGALLPTREVQRRILGFALPRTLSAGLEQSIIWFDVVLVGLIAGSAAAGVYGVASRFVGAGVIVLTAFRIVVAPRFSAGLAAGRRSDVQELYVVTAGWILLFGAPIYLLLAVFAPTVLGWLGPDFADGATPMRILCLGAVMLLAGGNIQSLLLMSGRSGWGAFNKAVVFGVNVAGNLVLVPPFGIVGAAVAWAACMTLDTTLAMVQVYRFTRIRPALGRILAILAAVLACAALPSLLAVWLLGNTTVSLLLAVALSGLALAAYCWVDRRRLRIDELAGLLPRRG